MLNLPETIQELSEAGCSDSEAMEIATDLMKKEYLKEKFNHKLDEIRLAKVFKATKSVTEQESALYKILSNLSQREKQCYILHTVQLMSMGKIAKQLGISKGTVQIYIERARNKIDKLGN